MKNNMSPIGTSSEELLQRAQAHYAEISTALLANAEKLKTSSDTDARRIGDLVRDHWKAFQSTLDLEINLEKRNREQAGISNGYALDLAAAGAEVGRRLACLKTAAGDREVSERSE